MAGPQNRLMILAVTLLIPAAAWTATASAQSLGDLARQRRGAAQERSRQAGSTPTTPCGLLPRPHQRLPPERPRRPRPLRQGLRGRRRSARGGAFRERLTRSSRTKPTGGRASRPRPTRSNRAKVLLEALQSRINGLQTDFINRDDPAARASIGAERVRALGELDRIKLEIQQRTKALADIREEARRAGVPSSWYR